MKELFKQNLYGISLEVYEDDNSFYLRCYERPSRLTKEIYSKEEMVEVADSFNYFFQKAVEDAIEYDYSYDFTPIYYLYHYWKKYIPSDDILYTIEGFIQYLKELSDFVDKVERSDRSWDN